VEIDRSSILEEIVGSSKPMRQVLKPVEKVAPFEPAYQSSISA
jgi:transcriptional regulator with GAF, ATPase, and Fis domain